MLSLVMHYASIVESLGSGTDNVRDLLTKQAALYALLDGAFQTVHTTQLVH